MVWTGCQNECGQRLSKLTPTDFCYSHGAFSLWASHLKPTSMGFSTARMFPIFKKRRRGRLHHCFLGHRLTVSGPLEAWHRVPVCTFPQESRSVSLRLATYTNSNHTYIPLSSTRSRILDPYSVVFSIFFFLLCRVAVGLRWQCLGIISWPNSNYLAPARMM